MKVRGERTEEENEDEVVDHDDVDDHADHLEQEDPRHSMYNPVSSLISTTLISVQPRLLHLTLFLLQRSSF